VLVGREASIEKAQPSIVRLLLRRLELLIIALFDLRLKRALQPVPLPLENLVEAPKRTKLREKKKKKHCVQGVGVEVVPLGFALARSLSLWELIPTFHPSLIVPPAPSLSTADRGNNHIYRCQVNNDPSISVSHKE
jgi:hypothetical protein